MNSWVTERNWRCDAASWATAWVFGGDDYMKLSWGNISLLLLNMSWKDHSSDELSAGSPFSLWSIKPERRNLLTLWEVSLCWSDSGPAAGLQVYRTGFAFFKALINTCRDRQAGIAFQETMELSGRREQLTTRFYSDHGERERERRWKGGRQWMFGRREREERDETGNRNNKFTASTSLSCSASTLSESVWECLRDPTEAADM